MDARKSLTFFVNFYKMASGGGGGIRESFCMPENYIMASGGHFGCPKITFFGPILAKIDRDIPL